MSAEEIKRVVIPAGSSVTVPVDTYTFSAFDGDGGAVDNRGTATITGGVFTGNTVTDSNPAVQGGGTGGAVFNEGSLTITGGTFSNNATPGIITVVDDEGKEKYYYYYGGAINSNSPDSSGEGEESAAGAVLVIDSADTDLKVTFSSNTSASGGAIRIAESLTENKINNAIFSGNTASQNKRESEGGGAILVHNSTLEISGTTFSKNYSAKNGGAIAVSGKNSVVTIKNSYFAENSAAAKGSAVYVYGGTVSLEEGNTFTGHKNTVLGTSLDKNNGEFGTLNITGGTFYKNTTNVINNAGSLNISGGTFSSNTGTLISNSGTVVIESGVFSGNTASGASINRWGLGINNNGSLAITGGTFANNAIVYSGESNNAWGGAINSGGGAKLTIAGKADDKVLFAGNSLTYEGTKTGSSAYTYGGAICIEAGEAYIANAVFEGNSATNGGAISIGKTNTSTAKLTLGGGIELKTSSDTIYNASTANAVYVDTENLLDNTGAAVAEVVKAENFTWLVGDNTTVAANSEGRYIFINDNKGLTVADADNENIYVGSSLDGDTYYVINSGNKHTVSFNGTTYVGQVATNVANALNKDNATVAAAGTTTLTVRTIVGSGDSLILEKVIADGASFNDSNRYGGIIQNEGGSLVIGGGTFANRAIVYAGTAGNAWGGAINNSGSATLTIAGKADNKVLFAGNSLTYEGTKTGSSAYTYGGAICIEAGEAYIANAVFEGNSATNGGAISIGKTNTSTAKLTLGGGIELKTSSDTIYNVTANAVYVDTENLLDNTGAAVAEVVKAENFTWLLGNNKTVDANSEGDYLFANDNYGLAVAVKEKVNGWTADTDIAAAQADINAGKYIVINNGSHSAEIAGTTYFGKVGTDVVTALDKDGVTVAAAGTTTLAARTVIKSGKTLALEKVIADGASFNDGSRYGGIIQNEGGSLVIGGGTFANCVINYTGTSDNAWGGAINSGGGAKLTIAGKADDKVLFAGNSLKHNGSGNTTTYGGAISAEANSTTTISNAVFFGNIAGNGGAIGIKNATATVNINGGVELLTFSDSIYGQGGTINFNGGTNTVNANILEGTISVNGASFVFHDYSSELLVGKNYTVGNIRVNKALANAASLTFGEGFNVDGKRLTVNMNSGEVKGTVSIVSSLNGIEDGISIATNFVDAIDKQAYTVNGNVVTWADDSVGYFTQDGTSYAVKIADNTLVLTLHEATDAASFNAMAKSDAVTDITLTGGSDFKSLAANGKELTITGEVKSQEAKNGYNFYGGGVTLDKFATGNVTIESGASVNFYAVCGGGYYNQGIADVIGSSSITVDGDVTTTRLLGGGQVSYSSETLGEVAFVTVEGNTSIVINGGNIGRGNDYSNAGNAAVVCGGWQTGGKASITVTGNSYVKINGGTIDAFVCGGGFLMKSTSELKQAGSASVTVTGGTIKGHIIGGIMANTKNTIDTTKGDDGINSKIVVGEGETATSVTIDTTDNTVTIVEDYNIYAGSFGKGFVSGDTCVTFKGKGSDLTFTGKVSGASSGATGKDTFDAEGKRINNDRVAGTKHLVFDGFTGAFGASEIVFMDTVTFTNSTVNFTNTAIDLEDVTTWNFNLSDNGQGQDFTDNTNTFFNAGDTININWSGDNTLLTNGVTVFTGNITGWNSGVTIKYTGTDAKLYASDDNKSLILGIA